MQEVNGLFQRLLILKGALLRIRELSANMSSLASPSEHSHLAVLMSAASMPSPAASVPAPASGQSLQVYDVGCSV
jgi:hypothetical protein